jgi:hypothetical protein
MAAKLTILDKLNAFKNDSTNRKMNYIRAATHTAKKLSIYHKALNYIDRILIYRLKIPLNSPIVKEHNAFTRFRSSPH